MNSKRGAKNASKNERFFTAKNIAYFAMLLALVIVLQLWGGSIKIGVTQLSFVLVPIVLCGMILGPVAGCLLGVIFGVIVYLQGLFGVDPFTGILISDHPVITALTCLVKGGAAGLVSGVLYNLFKNKDGLAASFIAAAAAPVVNTGLFIVGALCMSDTLSANFVDGTTVIYFLVIVCAGVNFLVELAINLIFAPAIFKLTQIIEKYIKR